MKPLHIIALIVSLIALAVSAATFRCPSCNTDLTVAPTTTPPPEPPPQTNVTGRLDLDRFSWVPSGGKATMMLPLGFAPKKIGLSASATSGFIGTLTPNASATYTVSVSGSSLCVQVHRADGDVLEFRFYPRSAQSLDSVRCTYYNVSGGKCPAGWTWRQKAATKWERVP